MWTSRIKSYFGFVTLLIVYTFPTVAVLQETTMKEINRQRQQNQKTRDFDDSKEIPHPYENEETFEGDTTHKLIKKGRYGSQNPTDKELDPFAVKPHICSYEGPECEDVFSRKSTYEEIFTKNPVRVVMKDFSFTTSYYCFRESQQIEPAATFSFDSTLTLYCYVKDSREREELIIPEDINLPNNY